MADVTISSLPLGTPAGNNTIPYSTGSNTLGVPVSAIFQNTNRVGIGTSSPIYPIEIVDNNLPYIVLRGSNSNALSMYGGTTAIDYSVVHSGVGKDLSISSNGGYPANGLYIKASGNVGIGTTAPAAKLDVNGDVKATSYKTGSLPMFGANAFVHFHGAQDVNGNASTANTARRIYAGGNVSSVVRNADGLYTIYFTTALTSTEYMAVCSARHRDGVTFITHSEVRDRLTTSCVVNVQSNPGGAEGSVAYDSRDVDVMIIC